MTAQTHELRQDTMENLQPNDGPDVAEDCAKEEQARPQLRYPDGMVESLGAVRFPANLPILVELSGPPPRARKERLEPCMDSLIERTMQAVGPLEDCGSESLDYASVKNGFGVIVRGVPSTSGLRCCLASGHTDDGGGQEHSCESAQCKSS